jgi:ribosome-interacting GTPase 1
LIRGADVALLLVDLGSDDGIEQCQEVIDKLATTKTRLAKESYLDEDDVGLSFTRTFLVPNKIDLPEAPDRLELLDQLCALEFPHYVISAAKGTGVEDLRQAIYNSLGVVRVYSKLPAEKRPDYDRPFTVRNGATLVDVAKQVHKDFVENFKYARVWGDHVHDGTMVKGDYVVHDKDVVELHQ